MTPSTEVATTGAAALGLTEEEYADLVNAQEEEFSNDALQTPILKVCQPLTKEVNNDDSDAEPGDFLNTLTGDVLGKEIDFVVAYYHEGRFASDRESGKAYVASGDVIPESWEPLVKAEWVGRRFDEHPDAEEQFKAAVNNKEREWGKGPLISNTHVYTGLALVQDAEGEIEMQPVRLSLKRTDVKAARTINSLRRMKMRNKPFWDKVYHLSTEKKTYAKGPAWNLVPKITRDTTDEERIAAVEVATAVRAGRVRDNLDSAGDVPVEPDAKGGIAV